MNIAATSEITETEAADERLVRIMTLNGDEFGEVCELPEANLVEHLSQWDYGDENDNAAHFNGYDTVSEVEHFGAHTVHHGDILYWIAVDNDLRMCSLLRRPIDL